MTPLQHEACQYFLLLSRLEYTLKNSGFVTTGKKDTASPNWEGFIAHVHEKIKIIPGDEDIKAFLKDPPKRQLYKDGAISWSNSDAIKATDRQEMLQACLTIRNNLFHGGKNADSEAVRNLDLLKAATKIVIAAIEACPTIKSKFDLAEL
jgi:hypothetical protein